MTEAVRCGRCGVLYDGRREKCPRCGGRVPRPIEARGNGPRPGSKLGPGRVLAVAAALGVVLVAVGGGVWAVSAANDAAASIAAAPPSPLARAFKGDGPRRMIGTPRVPTEIAFLDSPAAGRREYDGGNHEQALTHFRAQIENNPGDAEAHSNAGQVLIRLGRADEALPLLQEAADLDPNRWAYRFNLARAEGLLGRWDKAAQDYTEAARLFPGDYATLFNLGQALHRAGREEEAVAQYRLAIEQKPDDSSFYLALAASEEKLGHAAEAAAAYRRFVEMDPAARQADAVAARAAQLEKK